MLHILIAILIGIFVGWAASQVMNRHHGLVINLVIGVVGGLIGDYLAGVLHIPLPGFWSQLVAAIAGAIVLLFVLGLFRRRA